MTEDDGKLEEWMYDFAWKGKDAAQDGINILDNKAMNIINFTSIIIPIITGILIFVKGEQTNLNTIIRFFLLGAIVLLIITIFFAFKVIWVRNHGILPLNEHFKACGSDNYKDILFNTSKDIAKWQQQLLDLSKTKGKYLKRSSYIFSIALFLIFLSAVCILFL